MSLQNSSELLSIKCKYVKVASTEPYQHIIGSILTSLPKMMVFPMFEADGEKSLKESESESQRL